MGGTDTDTDVAPAAPKLSIEGLEDIQLIGSGAFAKVYGASEVAFGRRVAVKVMTGLDDDGRRWFERERELMGRVAEHRNIITPYRWGLLDEGDAFLVMEFAAGGSLEDRVRLRGKLAWAEAVAYLAPIADALGHAHGQGVLHHDIKPANVLITADNVAKLTDFGSSLSRATETASVSYTLAHTPPETFAEGIDARDERSDLYALASTLYTLVTGRSPFAGTGRDASSAHMQRILRHEVPKTGIGADIDRFLSRGLAKYPGQRPQTAAAFMTEMQAAEVADETDEVPAQAAARVSLAHSRSAPAIVPYKAAHLLSIPVVKPTAPNPQPAAGPQPPVGPAPPTFPAPPAPASLAPPPLAPNRFAPPPPGHLPGPPNVVAGPLAANALARQNIMAAAGGGQLSPRTPHRPAGARTVGPHPMSHWPAGTPVRPSPPPPPPVGQRAGSNGVAGLAVLTVLLLAAAALISGVSVSGTGSTVVIDSPDATMMVPQPELDEELGQVTFPVTAPTPQVFPLPGGEFLLSEPDGGFRVSDPDGPPESPVYGAGQPLNAFDTLDDDRVVSAGSDGRVQVWDLAEPGGAPITFWDGAAPGVDVAVLADGRIASAGSDGVITVGPPDLASGTEGPWQTSHPTVTALAALPDGGVASGGADGTIHIWHPERDLNLAAPLPIPPPSAPTSPAPTPPTSAPPGATPVVAQHGTSVTSLIALPYGRLVSAGGDRVLIWDTTDPTVPLQEHIPDLTTVTDVAALFDGRIVIGGHEGIRIWDSSLPDEEDEVMWESSPITSVAVLPAVDLLVWRTADGEVTLWPANGG